MLRRTPLKAKRATPRRNEGRVQHGRIKPKAKDQTAEERDHVELIRSLGCLICGRPAIAHHVMHMPGKRKRRDDRFVVPLCNDVHHLSEVGVHGLGSEEAFLARWGVDLVEWATEAWHFRLTPRGPFWEHRVTRCIEIAKLADKAHREGATGASNACRPYQPPKQEALT